MKKFYLLAAASLMAVASHAEDLDWSKISHWVGEGPNKAALVIQFYTHDDPNPGAIVWGYRWNDGENPTSEDMLLKIAAGSNDLTVLTQHTGWMGRTFCGAGYAADYMSVLNNLDYDFDGASSDEHISFGFFSPETAMGQTSVPDDPYGMVLEAIEEAKVSHTIDHPLNDTAFGYPAYDYDWWKLNSDAPENVWWNAGWYIDYWSFYLGSSMDDLSYSGMGISSVDLMDGDINAWKFRPAIEGSQENGNWLAFNYDHFKDISSAVNSVNLSDNSTPVYYHIDGSPAGENPAPGLYVKIANGLATKVLIK